MVVLVLLAVSVSLGVYKLLNKNVQPIDTRKLSVRKLTDRGQVVPGTAAVSPDGKWIAYVKREGERSLRVKQIATSSEVTVVPPRDNYYGMSEAFTPDGNYLYYVHSDPANANVSNVYAVPSLGGPSRKIVTDVNSAVALSPNGEDGLSSYLIGQG
jgi:Tol biopolymer transport system component